MVEMAAKVGSSFRFYIVYVTTEMKNCFVEAVYWIDNYNISSSVRFGKNIPPCIFRDNTFHLDVIR